MLRVPALAGHIDPFIDAFHHDGHSNCSPQYNHKRSLALTSINAALNEQKNRLMRYMETSVAFMGQVRAMVYMRYHLAFLSMAQKEANRLRTVINSAPVHATQVCDGVSIGLRLAACHVVRPWLIPNDLDKIKAHLQASSSLEQVQTVKQSMLFEGCSLHNYTMITNHQIRRILWELADRKPVTKARFKDLEEWVDKQKKELKPYIAAREDGDLCYLSPNLEGIRDVLAHWGCPDPEIKLVPPNVFEEVSRIIREKSASQQDLQKISVYSCGLHDLIVHDRATHKVVASKGQLSSQLLALLQSSLSKARNSLETGAGCTAPYSTPLSDFEEMVRTGSYFPNHPVIRTFPWFMYDFNNRIAKNKRDEEHYKNAKLQAKQELHNELGEMGHTCNKHKTSQRSLTPGIFTVFCGGCGVCEGFEMMPVAESPLTAFHVFANRAWHSNDHVAAKFYEDNNVWFDCIGMHKKGT